MRKVSGKVFAGYALAVAVFVYVYSIFSLLNSGWIENVTTTTLVVVIVLFIAVGMLLWNISIDYFKLKKEIK